MTSTGSSPWSGSRISNTRRSAPCPEASDGGSTSPSASSGVPSCCSSTSRRPASTPQARRDFHDLVHRLTDLEDTTILLTTHDLDEAEKLADRILILSEGRIVADGSADELARRVTREAQVKWSRDGEQFVHATTDATGFVRDLLNQDHDISDLEVRRATLEDTYLAMVQRQESGQGPGGVTQLEAAATSQAPEERAS